MTWSEKKFTFARLSTLLLFIFVVVVVVVVVVVATMI